MRRRRTAAEIGAICGAIHNICSIDHPMTVRQVFYRLVSEGVIEKTEAEYKATVVRLLGQMRESGDLPWSWIVDSTRWMRKPETYTGIEEALQATAKFYRRSLWQGDEYVEIRLEKESLAGVFYDVTEEWDVPLMVTRGYPSKSYLYSAAETITRKDASNVTIYYFGDLDPSGVDIPRATESALRRHAREISGREIFGPEFGQAFDAIGGLGLDLDLDFNFVRAAVTRDHVVDLDLQTRPTKRTDSRSRNFDGESVELDAIPPATLREMVRRLIHQHVDAHELGVLRAAEQSERSHLQRLAEIGIGGAS